ncbi:FkbM family methyltransferase [Natrialba sp. PRR66]|uniref:FkbM family methyltransferase n=1 Tax=Natrialba sp. PRR66 TaxID=3098146 RepID=UPI002B1D828D|nr:FkbM family methyltransferase [Natrialba sp. PRR66]
MTKNTGFASRATELYRDGGISELARGIRDFTLIRSGQARWIVGAALNTTVPVEVGEHRINFKTETAIEYRRARTQMHERQVLEDFIRSLRSDDIVWDCGSNVGLYATFAAEIAAESVAIEPAPSNVSALSYNLSQNDLENESTIIATALGSSEGTVAVPADAKPGENHKLSSSSGSTQVPIKCGDDITGLADAPDPTVLTMDIEGAEADALDGLRETLTNVRLAYVEVHEDLLADYGRSADDVMNILEETGFNVSCLNERRSGNYHLKAVANSRE